MQYSGPARGFGFTVFGALLIQVYGIFFVTIRVWIILFFVDFRYSVYRQIKFLFFSRGCSSYRVVFYNFEIFWSLMTKKIGYIGGPIPVLPGPEYSGWELNQLWRSVFSDSEGSISCLYCWYLHLKIIKSREILVVFGYFTVCYWSVECQALLTKLCYKGIEFVYESAYKAPHGYQQKDRIAVIAVAPTGKASFVYSYVQTRLKGE